MKKKIKLIMLLSISVFITACSSTEQQKEITLVTTTSLEDTGFLEYTLEEFEKKENVDVRVVAKGTGEALELGKRKDADILFVHAKSKEEEFINGGYGIDRNEIMYNYFVVVGPKGEKHNTKMNEMNVEEVFKYIKENNQIFVSRGDNSGTHTKELSIWENSGVDINFENYKEVGKGMASTLQMASEMRAYTLTDIGTYLATKENLDLEIVKQSDKSLKNVYSIVRISDLDEDVENITNKLVDYYESEETQNKIKKYGVDKYGEALFYTYE